MCKAWEEQKNEGRELGERQKIISLVVKKLQKDKSVAEIADDLEEKEEVIAPIYEAALSMKPDYDVEKIYELLEKNKKLAQQLQLKNKNNQQEAVFERKYGGYFIFV